MDFYVYDTDLNAVGIIDNYTSVIWTLRYNDIGDFEMYIKSTREILDMCQIGRYIVRKSDGTMMIIKSVVRNENVENGDYITVAGVSIENLISQRICWNITLLQGRAEECIYMLINENCINTTNAARVIPKLKLSPIKHLTAEIELTDITGINILDAVKQICDIAGYGFRITFDGENLAFEIYAGVDHSKNQTVNPYIIFDGECLSETNYQNDSSNYKNVALIGGSGENLNRVYTSYGAAVGLDRFELFVDNGSESDKTILRAAARDALHDYKNVKTFDGELSDYYAYGVNYALGDIVQIENDSISATSRITEVIQSIDDSGIYTIPTFSEWEVTT